MAYDPPRQPHPKPPKDPLEIELVYNVRPCGTCKFFWPENAATQPYGPYSSYDFDSNTPAEKAPESNSSNSFLWIQGTTRPPSFPDAEVMDGCRKAPIMTFGINPNLTAFGPGQTGASWCYPSFSSDKGTDSWAKYAYYYRYRSIYQEHFDLKFAEKFLLPSGQIKAAKPGIMQQFSRLNDDPAYEIRVLYDGDSSPTAIHLPGKLGAAPYVVLVNANQRFAKDELLAAQISVPAGHKVNVFGQPITYYTQMLPVLQDFEAYLKKKGHDAKLQVGEDVGQLDMVACASPHWGPQWLGGTSQGVNNIVANCVHKNAWAMKQLVQTQPAVILLVGQASWNMFVHSFGHLVKSPRPLPRIPEDGPYTLLRLTSEQESRLVFSTHIDGKQYSLSTRIVITPHFSYNQNFIPQFRMSPDAFAAFVKKFPQAADFLQHDPRIQVQKPNTGYVAVGLVKDAPAVLTEIKQKFAAASAELMAVYYDPHRMIADVFSQLFDKGELSYTPGKEGKPGFLSRSQGPCTFCDNHHWRFPKGCPYGKPQEKQYPIGFLEKVTSAMLAKSEENG